jgi:hypothetical protein
VAITHTKDAPIASRMGTPKSNVSMGMMSTPPPNPKTDPPSPAIIPPNIMYTKSDIFSLKVYSSSTSPP